MNQLLLIPLVQKNIWIQPMVTTGLKYTSSIAASESILRLHEHCYAFSEQILCFSTFINLWINVKCLIFRIDAAVPVKLLTHRQRRVPSINPFICEVTHSEVVEADILKTDVEGRVKSIFLRQNFTCLI